MSESAVEVCQFPLSHRVLTGYLYRASHASSCPLVVVLPDLFGVVPSLKETAAALARQGFHVLVPDLYSDKSLPGYCVRMLFDRLCRENEEGTGPLIEIHQLLDQAKQLPGVIPDRLGLVGQCLTGGFVLHMALRDDLAAPVVFHHSLGRSGSGMPVGCAARVKQPIQGHFVRIDPLCPESRVNQLKEQLGDKLEVNYYNWIPHGIPHFFRIHPEGRRAWNNMLEFLRRQLLAA